MSVKKRIIVSLLFLSVLFIVGCSDYQEDFTFTGTVEEIHDEEKMLIIKEYDGVDEGSQDGNVYEIPVDKVQEYKVGQKLKVTVFSNTDDDVWDLDRMKFKIRKIDD